jgi:hypothetical protein
MAKLEVLDAKSSMVFDSEVNELFSTYSIDTLMNRVYNNNILMGKIWDNISKMPEYQDLSEVKVYKYLTISGYQLDKLDSYLGLIIKFGNLPKVIKNKLFNALIPDYLTKHTESPNLDECEYWISECNKYLQVSAIYDLRDTYLKIRNKLQSTQERLRKESARKLLIDSYKADISELSDERIVNILLLLSGYFNNYSIVNGARLEKLLWLSTGLVLTDIIDTIYKYVKIKDEVFCSIKPEYTKEVSQIDYQNCGLKCSEIHSYYMNQCTSRGADYGRLPSRLPEYSLSNLRSTSHRVSSKSKLPQVSQFEALNFMETHVDEDYTYDEVKKLIPWFDRVGFKLAETDSGNNYHGFTLDSISLIKLSEILSKYDRTEFSNLRKTLIGSLDDKVLLTKMTESELRDFDCEVAREMIEKLASSDTISYNTLMGDMGWLRVSAHIGVSLRKIDKDSYRIFFNTVDFNAVVELIWKSKFGMATAVKVLDRLSSYDAFYREVKNNFNAAIWNLHVCQMKSYFK